MPIFVPPTTLKNHRAKQRPEREQYVYSYVRDCFVFVRAFLDRSAQEVDTGRPSGHGRREV